MLRRRHYKYRQHFLPLFVVKHSAGYNDSAPEQPRGCPETAPPFTFTLVG
jgi:hypothetical protein